MQHKPLTSSVSRLSGLPAHQLRKMIRDRDISILELVEDSLAAIEETDPKLNAFVTVCPERAMGEAIRAQSRVHENDPSLSLLGLPLAVKDAEPVAGMPMGCGSLVHAGQIARVDSIHVARLRAAGAIVVGKTNTPEFTLLGETRNRLGPDTCNPWDRSRTPGGSSGGSAAALAAGMVPLATGSDTAGSITVPSAFCGLVGLKPSHRRIPVWPNSDDWHPFADVGPMARCIPDLILMLAAASGPDARDPFASQDLMPPYVPRCLRVAFGTTLAGKPVDPTCSAAGEALAMLFAQAGHDVFSGIPDLVDPGPVLDLLGAEQEYRARGNLLATNAGLLMPETRRILEQGRDSDPREILAAREAQRAIVAAFDDFMVNVDLLVVPATACPAFPLRCPPSSINGRAVVPDWPSYAPFNMLANLTGCPVATLPMHLAPGGLPVGALVFAKFGCDALLLSALAEAAILRGEFPIAPDSNLLN